MKRYDNDVGLTIWAVANERRAGVPEGAERRPRISP